MKSTNNLASRKYKSSLLHGLVGWWRMDEGSGLSAYDSSGLCNHGSMANMDNSNWKGGADRMVGNALNFNGIDEYIDCGKHSSLDITGDITISAWVKLNSLQGYLISKNINSVGDNQYGIFFDIAGFVTYHPTDTLKSVAGSILTGIWIHIILTRIGGTGQFYIDGVTSGSSAAINMPSRDTEINIGRRKPDNSHYDGIVDDVHIYNRALSEDEIKCLAGVLNTIWNAVSRTFTIGKVPIIDVRGAGDLIAGSSSTFNSDGAHVDGWLLNITNDEIWIGAETTGKRIIYGNTGITGHVSKIEYRTNYLKFYGTLNKLYCAESPTDLTGTLDVSALTNLTTLYCHSNSISTLDVSALTSLTTLNCHSNSISTLDVSALTNLILLRCNSNSISTLDVSALTSLTTLYCHSNSISTLDVSALTSLTHLHCGSNGMTQNAVNTIIDDLYANRASMATCVVNIAGTNSAPSTAQITKITDLVDNYSWTITYTAP